ncbi:MAG: branched-chain amino acid aminotransferase [Bacteroidetes bacterium]|nr:branched-chain amino acid aminotransferase [Bacteroidota bacterium]
MEFMETIKVTKAATSKLREVDFNNLGFGRYFTDHMLMAKYQDGRWQAPEILPYGPICFDPAMATLHYGQSIFEGVKAFRMQDGRSAIFRPYENLKRFNRSAHRMEMPEISEDIFIGGMRKLLQMEDKWIPHEVEHAMYIRPFMFGTNELLGVMPSSSYLFMIILSPVGPYYAAPMRIQVEEKYVRAVEGGIGRAKTAGNYAASLHPFAIAQKNGFDQILWTDAHEHKYVQECGTINIFFLVDGRLITPSLANGTILEGVTRDSVIKVARDIGIPVEERNISILELIEAHQAGLFTEAFGTGTAATISKVQEIRYKDRSLLFEPLQFKLADTLKAKLTGIRDGIEPDVHNWMLPVFE